MKTNLIKSAATAFGRKGGQTKSPAKAAAAQANGRKGGRPRTRNIDGRTLRKNSKTGLWDILEMRGPTVSSNVLFSGTLAECRAALKVR